MRLNPLSDTAESWGGGARLRNGGGYANIAVLVVVVGRLEPRAKVLVTGGSAGSIS